MTIPSGWLTLEQWKDVEHFRFHPTFDKDYLKFFLSKSLKFPLYKATMRCWADKFYETGQLRLGTIWDYRREELGGRLGDPDEGRRYGIFDRFKDCAGGYLNIAKDCYVFCSSEKPSFDEFRADGYDAVYRINSIGFFGEIAAALNKSDELLSNIISPVVYATNREYLEYVRPRLEADADFFSPINLLKDPSFSTQCEVRGLFEPVKDVNKAYYPTGKNNGLSHKDFDETLE